MMNKVVFTCMTQRLDMDAQDDTAYRVRTPRAADAIGEALREAYDRNAGLPDDMLSMLHQLNDSGNYHA